MVRPQRLPELLTLVVISAGFAAAILAYRTFYPDLFDYLTSDEVALGFLTSVGAFWLGVRLTEPDRFREETARAIRAFCAGTGINLIIQAWFNYLDILTRSMFLIVVGGAAAAALLAIADWLFPERGENLQPRTVMVGFDRISAGLVRLLPDPLAVVIGDAPQLPGLPVAPYTELEATLARLQPREIVVAGNNAGHVDPRPLLELRLKGASVSSAAELYEDLLERVCCAGRNPADLLLSQRLSGNPQAMAFQAIYTNLIGLALLIAAVPVILALQVIALLSGAGSIIESEEYCGFHNIPFLRMRFRTRRRDGSGEYHPIGRLIAFLHLTELPLLFNIIRGEMALFGPHPVRREFAARLAEIIPFYSMRFAVKPGIFDWEDAQRFGSNRRASTLTAVEYDLYYVKYASPLLDLEILTRLIFGGRARKDANAELAAA